MHDLTRRTCTTCGTGVPEDSLSCPSCGRYFAGGFELSDLIEGIRAVHPVDDEAPAAYEGDEWRPPEPVRPFGDAHGVALPRIGAALDLPYATAADDTEDDAPAGANAETDEVIDLRERPRTGSLFGRRERTRS